jgi:hypothetical protein
MDLYFNLGTVTGPLLRFIPGINIGCYIIDGVFESTLELLFDQNEIDLLLRLLFPNQNQTDGMYPALNSTLLQRFAVKTPVKELAGRLFVDNWKKVIFHEKYFLSCKPKECHYSVVKKRGIIVTITIVVGIIGGLNSVLRFIVPLFIEILFWIKGKFVNSTESSSSVDNGKFVVLYLFNTY